MKRGLLEIILTRRYGFPVPCIRNGRSARGFDTGHPNEEALLYVGMKWSGIWGVRFASLREIYGDALGGFLLGDSLRAALLSDKEVYALWNIEDLRAQPEVQHATLRDPTIDYFMDAANVWFYGHKAGELYVFDASTDELDCLGPIEPALGTLLDQWEATG